jgi:hypothetical protein
MPNSVYLSDTSSELQDLRPIILDQINAAGMTAVEMTAADRQQPNMMEIARQKIADADYFIAIVTYTRAWEPEGAGGKSLAEIEYELARELGKPLVILLPKDKSDMGMKLRLRALTQGPREHKAQHEFWQQVTQSALVNYFADEADLARQVGQILSRWAASQPAAVTLPAPAQTLSRERQELLPTSAAELDALAQRIAERVEAIQQKRDQQLAEQAVKVNEALRLFPGELVFGRPAATSQFKSDVFMIMPFAPEYSGIYTNIIKPLMADMKLTIVRGDEFTSSRGVIIEEVCAEISGGNDNVFYELGIAHTLNKPALLITQAKSPDDVPFDIRHLRYIQYENTAAGGAKLRDDLQNAITRLLADLEEGWGTQPG